MYDVNSMNMEQKDILSKQSSSLLQCGLLCGVLRQAQHRIEPEQVGVGSLRGVRRSEISCVELWCQASKVYGPP